MNRLSIQVENVAEVVEVYNQMKVYRASSETGTYAEITVPASRIQLTIADEIYWFDDLTGTANHWYKTSYYNSLTFEESELSDPRQGGTQDEKIGWTFGNYEPPPGEWGEILTADDMRYTYLFGIDAVAQDVNKSEFSDAQFLYYVRSAMADFESFLTMDIRRRIYKCRPANTLVRAPQWREGVDYTDEDDPYEFQPELWTNYGFIRLRHFPLISVERCDMMSPVGGVIMELADKNWVRPEKASGQIYLYPRSGASYGPYAIGSYPWRAFGTMYPDGFEIDYTTGYSTAQFVPKDLQDIVAKYAAIKCLASVGDGLLAGFSSQSISLDGLSESFSSTQSATSAYFGARIKEYQEEVKDWLARNRYKYGRVPLGFIGSR